MEVIKYMMTYFRFGIWIVIFLWTALSVPLSYGLDKGPLSALGFQELSGKKEAPDFTLLSLDGRKVSLQDYRGKVVFLHFWATWCKPCIEEFPTIERIHKEYKDKGLAILAVSIDKGDKDVVKSFVDKTGVSFPILLATDGNIKGAYWTWGTPTSFLIDRNGKILGRALGPRKWDSIEARALFEAALKD